MTYEEVKDCITQMNVTSVKIIDTAGNKVLALEAEKSPENLINKLEMFKAQIMGYGRVTVLAANDAQYKQNWKDCFKWVIIFNPAASVTSNTPQVYNPIAGMVSAREAELMAELKEIKLQRDFDVKLAELEKKIDGKNKPDDWDKIERAIDKYSPMLMPMLGMEMSPQKMDAMMKMYQMQAMMQGKIVPTGQAGIAGTGAPVIKTTEEEQNIIAQTGVELDKLNQKISADKILAAIKYFNDNPESIEMLMSFVKPKQ